MFYQQLIALCEREGVKPTPLIKSLGFSAGNIKRWENGATVNSDILLAISKHFKVSIDYLLTGKENQATTLSADEQELLENYRQLAPDDKEKASKRVEELTTQDTSNKEHNIEPVIQHLDVSKINIYEQDLLKSFRELPFGEQMKIIGKVETLAEIFKSEENVG